MTEQRPVTDEEWELIKEAGIGELERLAAQIRAFLIEVSRRRLTPREKARLRELDSALRTLRANLEFELAPDEAAAVRKVLGDLASTSWPEAE